MAVFTKKNQAMKIKTGQTPILPATLLAIWSISALNALPGLAVSPILGQMSSLFPQASRLSIEMLTTLPSLLIIPFILLSGRLTARVGILVLLRVGLIIFALSGVLYLLSDAMWQLIAVSVMLGAGAGLIVPLSTGLISHFFIGEYRTKQFGLSSAITNLTLVIVTAVTGYLAEFNWHLPFVVYLLPLVSLLLTGRLRKDLADTRPGIQPDMRSEVSRNGDYGGRGIDFRRLVPLMLFYGVITFLTMTVVLNVPFVLEMRGDGSEKSGIVISLLFLAIMAPGFILPQIIRFCGPATKLWSLLLMLAGVILILSTTSVTIIALGAICVGLGYGVMQPAIYDQTTAVASPHRVTMALAWVMSMNYVAIVVCPLIIDVLQYAMRLRSTLSPFYIAMAGIVGCIIWARVQRHKPLFDK